MLAPWFAGSDSENKLDRYVSAVVVWKLAKAVEVVGCST